MIHDKRAKMTFTFDKRPNPVFSRKAINNGISLVTENPYHNYT